MAKVIDCARVTPGSGCAKTLHADTEEELMEMVGAHAREAHNMEPTPELEAIVKANIQDD